VLAELFYQKRTECENYFFVWNKKWKRFRDEAKSVPPSPSLSLDTYDVSKAKRKRLN
jgi:hypothetical protein